MDNIKTTFPSNEDCSISKEENNNEIKFIITLKVQAKIHKFEFLFSKKGNIEINVTEIGFNTEYQASLLKVEKEGNKILITTSKSYLYHQISFQNSEKNKEQISIEYYNQIIIDSLKKWMNACFYNKKDEESLEKLYNIIKPSILNILDILVNGKKEIYSNQQRNMLLLEEGGFDIKNISNPKNISKLSIDNKNIAFRYKDGLISKIEDNNGLKYNVKLQIEGAVYDFELVTNNKKNKIELTVYVYLIVDLNYGKESPHYEENILEIIQDEDKSIIVTATIPSSHKLTHNVEKITIKNNRAKHYQKLIDSAIEQYVYNYVYYEEDKKRLCEYLKIIEPTIIANLKSFADNNLNSTKGKRLSKTKSQYVKDNNY